MTVSCITSRSPNGEAAPFFEFGWKETPVEKRETLLNLRDVF